MKERCLKCGHTWTKRKDNPKMCPRCKNYNYKVLKGGENKDDETSKEKI